MKNLLKPLIACLAMLLSFSFLTAFTTSSNTTKTSTEMSTTDNSCTLYVKTSAGYPARSIKVSTDVSGGISCSGGRNFYTDSNGKVDLKWVSGCYLKKIFVDGKGYDVDYKDGKTYHLTMK